MYPPIFWKVLLEVFRFCLGFFREVQVLRHEVESSECVDGRDRFLDLDHLKFKSLNLSKNEDDMWAMIQSKIVNRFKKTRTQPWINLHDYGVDVLYLKSSERTSFGFAARCEDAASPFRMRSPQSSGCALICMLVQRFSTQFRRARPKK